MLILQLLKITDAKLYVLIVTLSVEDNSKLSKLFNEGFKRPIYRNEYKVTPNKIVEFGDIIDNNNEKYIRELLDSSCQGVKRLFVLAYDNTEGNNQFSVDSYKNTFFQELKWTITILKLMVESFMINQLTELNNRKLEKYLQNKVMITQLVVY